MKRFVFAFASCETRYYTVTIKNDSSKSVTYTYDDITDTLAVSGSKEYQVKVYTQPPKDISVLGVKSIEITRSGDVYAFIDITPISVKILNTLAIDVRITAGGYVENGGKPFVLSIVRDN